MRFWPRFALLCLLLLAAAAPPAAGATAVGSTVQTNDLPAESTTLTLQLQASGDATWAVSTRFRLDDESDREAFDRLASDFESGDADVAYDTATFERAAAAASNATGREMAVTGVQYDASRQTVDNVTYGRLTLRFRWTNFAERANDRLEIGNAFNTTDGTWLPGLARDQTLVIQPPEGYAVLNSPPDVGVQNGVLRWEGPRSFEPGYLGAITYTGDRPTTTTDDPDAQSPPLGLLGGGALLLVVVAAAAVVFARRDDGPAGTTAETSADGGDGGSGAAARSAPDATTDGTAAADGSEPELLSDEEQVERLLKQNDGRMKQATIVEETGWSNAKVSQLLSGMAEADRINKLRIGRENLISLPDEDVTDIDDE